MVKKNSRGTAEDFSYVVNVFSQNTCLFSPLSIKDIWLPFAQRCFVPGLGWKSSDSSSTNMATNILLTNDISVFLTNAKIKSAK